MSSVIATINRYKASWTNRFEVNSTIKELNRKITVLMASRCKELKKCSTESERDAVRKRYDNDIKFYDDVLFYIQFEYYNIIGNLNNERLPFKYFRC